MKEEIESMINSMLDFSTEYRLAQGISSLSAIVQLICNTLIAKKIISADEYKEIFSKENIETMEKIMQEEAKKVIVGDKE